MRLGAKARVLNNRFPDVLAGTVGRVTCKHQGGYGVAITGDWMVAGSDRGQVYYGTETVWYEAHELEAVC